MEFEPPLVESYMTLFSNKNHRKETRAFKVEECTLPLIDLNQLISFNHGEREKCKKEIANVASKWGFFQIINHGIPSKVLKSMQHEQRKAFHQPFHKKAEKSFFNLSANSYRWGNPLATCPRQFSWSEAFHIPLTEISRIEECNSSLRSTIEVFAVKAASLAQSLAEILVENYLGYESSYFQENCSSSTSYLRMNRYPPCQLPSEVFGLMPHTDTDFLTVLYQDQVGGLQLVKDGRWVSVNPIPDALIINVGDLFEAWSNGVYKSVEHQVTASTKQERFSLAYFYCPYSHTIIKSCTQTPIYRSFSFKEYKQQVLLDVEATGDKVGLSRFLL